MPLSKRELRQRFSQLNALMYEWDPIGVNPNGPRDEYECLVGSTVNPTKNTILERLRRIDQALEPLAIVCERYLRYCSAVAIDETLMIGHQPWKGPEAYAVRIFPAAKKNWFSKYSRIHGLKFPSDYKTILASVNGINAFGLSLYGIPPSMFNKPPLLDRSKAQCLDIGSANVHWSHAPNH